MHSEGHVYRGCLSVVTIEHPTDIFLLKYGHGSVVMALTAWYFWANFTRVN